jgi:chromosome segregation ATPase
MKQYLSIALTLVCALLVISLVMMKRSDDAQQEKDAGAIADFSNLVDSAQIQIAAGNGTILTFSNSLNESQAASLTFSNQLTAAESAVALDTEQITNLNLHVAELVSENQTLGQRVTDLTNQMTSQMSQMTSQMTALTRQIALTQTNLDQANKDYVLLENRLRRDVAERVVMQRKFYNRAELQAQLQRLKEDPFVQEISEESIYAGLDVEVKSNTYHVISPD